MCESGMDNIIKKIKDNRNNVAAVENAWSYACKNIGVEKGDPIVKFGFMLSRHPDLQSSTNAYHNNLHAADTVICASELAKREFNNPVERKKNGVVLLMSMLAHDIQHNGKHNQFDYELEQKAFNSLNDFVNSNKELKSFWDKELKNEYGSWEYVSKNIEKIILGTDFKLGPTENMKNYNQESNGQYQINKLKMLANEADILPSCSADFGPQLGLMLAKEQDNPGVGSWKGREFFLSKLANFGSDASKDLGVQQHIKKQVEVIQKHGAENLDKLSENGNFTKIAQKVKSEVETVGVNLNWGFLDKLRDAIINTSLDSVAKNKIR